MDLVYDFIPPNLNRHLDVDSIFQLRMTSKHFDSYSILESHKYIRRLYTNDILNFSNNSKDFYQLSICIEENYISKSILEKIHSIMKQKSIISIKIINNPVVVNGGVELNLDNNLIHILGDCLHFQFLRYISLNFIYFWKFSKQRENIILKKPFNKNFDTFHINFKDHDIKDLNCILPYLNRLNYPSIKNIILDNLIINSNDLRIFRHNYISQNNIIIGESRDVDSSELNFCHNFIYNSDFQLKKTEFINIDDNYKIYIYHYNREYELNILNNIIL